MINIQSNFLKISSQLFSLTFLSRLLGLCRDLLIAWIIGADSRADVLACALRIPHILRRLLHEGSLSLTLTRFLIQSKDAFLLAKVKRIFFLIFLIATVFYALFSPQIAWLLAPHFSVHLHESLCFLIQISSPYILFIGLSAFSMAILHANGIFWASALCPTFLNLILIAFLFLGFFFSNHAPTLLIIALCLGGLVQWLFQMHMAMRHQTLPSELPKKPPCRNIAKILDADSALGETCSCVSTCFLEMSQGIIASSAQHLAFLLGMVFLSQFQGYLAAQFYAERILELPLALISVCLGIASLPMLSHLAEKKNFAYFSRLLTLALHCALFLLAPAVFGILAVGADFVAIFFGHGNFTAEGVEKTWTILCAYIPALPACALSRILLSACIACKGTRFTCLSTILVLFLTALFCLFGLFPPLSVSLALFSQPILLGFWLRNALAGKRPFFFAYKRLVRSIFCAAIACLLAKEILLLGKSFYADFSALLLAVLGAILMWLWLLSIVSRRDYRLIKRMFQKKKKKAQNA